MTQADECPDQMTNNSDSAASIAIDPLNFFHYAASSQDRWRELIGLTINHCTFGSGTIRKIDGDYIYIDLPQRQGKKNLTEFGLESFRRGFFNNLQISPDLQQKILVAAAEALTEAAQQSTTATEPAKKKKKAVKAKKTTV